MTSGNQRKHESRNPIQRALIARFQRQAAALVRSVAPRTILDLGCGEGYTLRALLDAGVDAELHGVDASPAAIADARIRLGGRAHLDVADARDLAADGRSFDLVLMLEVLEHIPRPEQMLPVLRSLAREHVLLSVPREPFFCALNLLRGKNLARLGNDPEHVNHWGRRGFFRFIAADFEPLASPAVFPWTMVLARPRR